MKLEPIEPPRTFAVAGRGGRLEISHCATVSLDPDEQVTFSTPSGTELDVVRKSWGYYATPSLNRRLAEHGLRALLVRNDAAAFLLLVEPGREPELEAYLAAERLRILCWLDSDEALERVTAALESDG